MKSAYENAIAFYEIKGSTLLGITRALREAKQWDDVYHRVSASTQRLLDAPPAATAWIDNSCSIEIYGVLADLHGLAYVRTFNKLALTLGVIPVARLLVEGTLRLFGSTPTALYSRTDTLMQVGTRGLQWEHRNVGRCTDELLVTFLRARTEVPLVTLELFAGTLEKFAELCGHDALVTYQRLPGPSQRIVYKCVWREVRKY